MMLLESVCHQFDGEDVEKRSCRYLTRLYSVTVLLWGSSLAIGATVTDLDFVLALSGSLCGSALCYVLPAMVVIQTNGLWINRFARSPSDILLQLLVLVLLSSN